MEKIRPNYLNQINSGEIINNSIINLENEMIHIHNKNELNLPKHLNKYNINQIPEKVKGQDQINLNDKMIIMNNLDNQTTNYSFSLNKKGINIPEIKLFSPELNIIEVQPKYKKINYLEKPLEDKKILINSDIITKKSINKNEKNEINMISSDYQILIPKITLPSKIQNVINNQNVMSNNLFTPLLKEEYKFTEYHEKNKFLYPTDITLNLNQYPEKLKKPKIINVQNITNEINLEHIRPNKTLKREIKKEIVNKDEISEDLENMKKIYKKQINKIDINDKLFESNDTINVINTNYEINSNKNKGNNYIPNIIHNIQEINPIKLNIKLKSEKINLNEKPNEIKEITIKPDIYYNKISVNKNPIKEDKLSILLSDYQLTDFNPTNEYLKKKINNLRNKRNSKFIKIKNEPGEMTNKKTSMNKPIRRGKEINKIFIKKEEVFDDINIMKKILPKKQLIKTNINDDIKLSTDIELNPIIKKDEKIKKINNPDSTLFKFYDSKNKQLAMFNSFSLSQNSTNTNAQKQFFNFMHKKFVAFKLFNMKNNLDPRKKWFKIWNKNSKE